jgi:hypothetical protein
MDRSRLRVATGMRNTLLNSIPEEMEKEGKKDGEQAW